MPKPNWANAASQGIQGASTGASIGGPWGAAIGGTIGTVSGLLSGKSGKGNSLGTFSEELQKVPTGTPEQQKFGQDLISLLNQSQGQGGGYSNANNYYNQLLGPNQQEAFNQFASPYLQQFQEQVLPNIAERFAGGGALSSSGFGQALGGAGAGLQAQLAQLFSGLQQQAAQQQYGQFNQMANTGLNYQPFAYYQKPGGADAFGGFLQGFDMDSLKGISSLFKNSGKNNNPTSSSGLPNFMQSNLGGTTKTSGSFGLPTFLGQ